MKENEFAVRRYFFPIEDRNAGTFRSTPLPVTIDQCVHHQMPPKQWPHFEMFAELTHHRQAIIDFRHYVGVRNRGRRLGVVFAKPESPLFVEEGIHARCGTGCREAGIHLYQFFLPILQTELCAKACICHRSAVDLLKGGHYRVDANLQSAIFVRVNEAWTQDRAERSIPKKQTA